MSDPAPPPVPGHAAEGAALQLTPETIEQVLAEFRRWLTDLTASPEADIPAIEEPPDLHTLLGQLIAVRQEVNLQTRAVRAQQEQNSEALKLLAETVERLDRQPAPQPQPSSDELIRPLLKILIDVHDALSLAMREAQRVEDSVLPLLVELAGVPQVAGGDLSDIQAPPLQSPPRPFLARL